eukprot:366240-Chlamydomonas_euryale.AAC.5
MHRCALRSKTLKNCCAPCTVAPSNSPNTPPHTAAHTALLRPLHKFCFMCTVASLAVLRPTLSALLHAPCSCAICTGAAPPPTFVSCALSHPLHCCAPHTSHCCTPDPLLHCPRCCTLQCRIPFSTLTEQLQLFPHLRLQLSAHRVCHRLAQRGELLAVPKSAAS